MNKKLLVITILAAMFLATSSGTAFSKPIALPEKTLESTFVPKNIFYVSCDKKLLNKESIVAEYAQGTLFNGIQEAIDAASAGDLVFVLPGTYEEAIILKEGVYVVGSGYDNTKIDATGINTEYAVMGASYSVLQGFHIKNVSETASVIKLNKVRNMKILNNMLVGQANYGIHMQSSAFNLISGNVIGFADDSFEDVSLAHGIYLHGSSYNSVTKNKILSNQWAAILGHYAPNTQIHYNLIARRQLDGGSSSHGAIYFVNCNNASLVHNTIICEDSGTATPAGGLVIYFSQGCTMLNNISLGTRYGVFLDGNSQLSASYSTIFSEDLINGEHVKVGEGSVFNEGLEVSYENPMVNKETGKLFSGSPCIDAAKVIDFNDPDNTTPEIGAFYYSGDSKPMESNAIE
ncbi:MAG: right-handed parallel beta-helix repeat-containing protein [Candidatus Aceula meridiana]|nr:right-handed parallel beta-helix repeat-containing protein [Candidatus Aceula meridiana]